jgi:protein arginine N-methyltransferase 3
LVRANDKNGIVVLRSKIGLDFYGAVKMVNYIRSEVKEGNLKPQVSSRAVFEDDRYLKPVLEGDALLIGLDDVLGETEDENASTNGPGDGAVTDGIVDGTLSRISELEGELQKLQSQFLEYRETVKKTLDDRWNDKEDTLQTTANGVVLSAAADGAPGPSAKRDDDSHYFTSYSYNGTNTSLMSQLSSCSRMLTAYDSQTSMRRC